MMTIFVTFWGQFGMHYALDTCKRSLYCICTQSLLYCNSRDVWDNIQFAEEKQAGDSEACFAWCHSKHIYQPLCHSTEVPLAWPRPWDMQRHHTSADTHASRKTHKKKCRVTYLKTHCAGLDWARHVDRKWTLGHSVAVFLSGQKWNTHLWKTIGHLMSEISRHLTERVMVTKQTVSKHAWLYACPKCIFGHVKMWSS